MTYLAKRTRPSAVEASRHNALRASLAQCCPDEGETERKIAISLHSTVSGNGRCMLVWRGSSRVIRGIQPAASASYSRRDERVSPEGTMQNIESRITSTVCCSDSAIRQCAAVGRSEAPCPSFTPIAPSATEEGWREIRSESLVSITASLETAPPVAC